MTDYTGVSFDDVLAHMKEWLAHADAAIGRLNEQQERIATQRSILESPGEAEDFASFFLDLFERYRGDLQRLVSELPSGVTSAHIAIVEQMYESARHEERYTIRFKQDWIAKGLPNEGARPLLDDLYANVRTLLIDFWDLSNILPRLKTFVGHAPTSKGSGEALPDLHLKPNVFGIGINLNRLLGRFSWFKKK